MLFALHLRLLQGHIWVTEEGLNLATSTLSL